MRGEEDFLTWTDWDLTLKELKNERRVSAIHLQMIKSNIEAVIALRDRLPKPEVKEDENNCTG